MTEEEEEEEAFNPISELRKPEGEIEEGKVLRRRRRRGGQHFCLLLLLLSFFFLLFPRRPFKGPKKLFLPFHPTSISHFLPYTPERALGFSFCSISLSFLRQNPKFITSPPFLAHPPHYMPRFPLETFPPVVTPQLVFRGGGKWMDEKKASPGGKKTTQIRKKAFSL